MPRRGRYLVWALLVAATALVLALVVSVATGARIHLATSTWLTGTSDGTFDGPTAFASWPVDHADCFSFGVGLVCVTPEWLSASRLPTPLPTVAPLASTRGAVVAKFLLANSGNRAFTLHVTPSNSGVEYQANVPGPSRTLELDANPRAHDMGCGGLVSGEVDLAAHSHRIVCLAFPVPRALGAVGPHAWTQLAFGGIAQWANGHFQVPVPNGAPAPLAYELAIPSMDFSSAVLQRDEAGIECEYIMVGPPGPCGPAGSPTMAIFTDLDGTDLGYGHGLLPLTTGPRARACELANQSPIPCFYDTPAPSDGPIVMLLTFANPQRLPWTVELQNVVADAQEQCTKTGCATARLVPTYPTSTYDVPHCVGAATGVLPAASRARPGTITFCVQFATTSGAVIYRVGYRLVGIQTGSPSTASFSYVGYPPPGPF